MKKYLVVSILLVSSFSWALNFELGVSYARKKNSFDRDNYFDTESATGSMSMYFSEMLGLEMSYTEAKATRYEKIPNGNESEIFQKTQVLGADLILVLAPRKSMFQPYVKGGAAQLQRSQVTHNITLNKVDKLDIETSVVPSYGAGLKIKLTEGLSMRLSYDVWRTPVGGGVITDDSKLRAGLSWML